MLKLAELRTALTDKAALQEKLTAATNDLASTQADLEKSNDDLTAAQEQAAELQKQIDEANAALEEANGKVSTLEAEKKTVAQTTVDTLHELGVAAPSLPKSATPGDDDAAIYERYQALSGAKKTEFLRANRAALERHAAHEQTR